MNSGHPKHRASFVLFYYYLSSSFVANAFLTPSCGITSSQCLTATHGLLSPTRLNYRDHGHDDDADDRVKRHASSKKLTIPVLGPIPGAMPLVVGGDMYLDPPTPMQWLTLEESILAFQQQNITVNHPTIGATATIDASPLVAVIHDSTNADGRGARYATLAAVVGMSASSAATATMVDPTDLSETIRSSSKQGSQLLPYSSRIRLVGVGRAMLHEFYYRISLTDLDDDDHDGEHSGEDANTDMKVHDDEDDDELTRKTPIIVASFQLLSDDGGLSSSKSSNNKYGVHSRFSSPVHALARMSSAANRLIRLHDDRRRLVRGLQAAKMRLEYVTSRQRGNTAWGMKEEDDYDGLGLVTSSSLFSSSDSDDDDEMQQSDIDNLLLHTFPSATLGDYHSIGMLSRSLLDKENYGLGFSAASLSSIPALTKALLEKLEPYYTPEKIATEEFYYEALSFCAMRSLESYFVESPYSDYWTWGLTCTNTVERLEQVHDWLWQHKIELEMLAKQASQDLRDCGEECTDLW